MILIIDNYDSFVHNLARYVRLLGYQTRVVRNDELDNELVDELSPTHIIISPGPGSPAESGASCAIISRYGSRIPVLGVCLGHQCIGAAYGMVVGRAGRPVHGKQSEVFHREEGIFSGIPSPFRAGRYHSLALDHADLPAELEVIATADDGEIMAVRHREHPVWGLQFHPESVLTEYGSELLAAFLQLSPPR
ncbi:aminodeoxychorismate/anthranilate synthase component II [soil metagenome]